MFVRVVDQILVALVAALVLGVFSAPAAAQSKQVPQSARGVLSLITERVNAVDEAGEVRPESIHFWWSAAGAPDWSESDEIIQTGLERHQVQLLEPDAEAGISKIYRRADLSLANAATLGSLLGARRVLVGSVEFTRQSQVGLVGLERVSALADISLVSAETGTNTALQRFTVRRDGFAPSAEEALKSARAELAEAFAELAAAALLRGAGPVGVQSDEQLIGLYNAGSAQNLQHITQFLEGLDSVDAVRVRWAAEGLITLEINPGKRDAPSDIEYAIRALSSEHFDDFRLSRRASSSGDGVTEFEVLSEREAF